MAEQRKTDQEQYGTTKINRSRTWVVNLIHQEHVHKKPNQIKNMGSKPITPTTT